MPARSARKVSCSAKKEACVASTREELAPGVKMEFQRPVAKVAIFGVYLFVRLLLWRCWLWGGKGDGGNWGVALLALGGGMNSGVFGFLGSKEMDELWMEGRAREVPGNYGALLALHCSFFGNMFIQMVVRFGQA